ncbi:MAG: cytochrome P450 [Gammaproteobacteria bacterium]|nr:cytochrome P450 [Gammaproteobacteria bacterium]
MRFATPDMIEDPYPRYAQWREQMPIWRDEATNGWVLTRHDDVHDVLRKPAIFSSAAMGQGSAPLPLLTDDPPRHTQLRTLVIKAFTSRMLKSMEASVERIANELLDEFPLNGDLDAVQRFTIPLPVAVIAQMMGIPGERADDFKRWSDALTGTLAGVSMEERQTEIFEMASYFQSLIPDRREHPGEDLVSAVVNAEIDGERLSDQDIVGFNVLLLIAGNETTTNLLGNFLNIVADRPEIWSTLRERPELVEAAIEETLRFDAPVQFLMRKAVEDAEFHGQQVSAGENVIAVMGAANRDPSYYDGPDTFCLDREKNRHHTFGYGIHFCLGAPLARLEAKLGIEALLRRFPTFERGEGPKVRVPSHLLRGFEHLSLAMHRH